MQNRVCTDEYSQDYVIKDFKADKDADKIIIKGNGSNAALTGVEAKQVMLGGKSVVRLTATCGDCMATPNEKALIDRNIYLEGVDLEDAEGWVRMAKNNLDIKDQEKLPIMIIK